MNISTNRNTCTPPLEVGRWGGKDWEFGVSRCKLLYMEWIEGVICDDLTMNIDVIDAFFYSIADEYAYLTD